MSWSFYVPYYITIKEQSHIKSPLRMKKLCISILRTLKQGTHEFAQKTMTNHRYSKGSHNMVFKVDHVEEKPIMTHA
jgi:hypothetical protein